MSEFPQTPAGFKQIPLTAKRDPYDSADYLYECNFLDIIPAKVDLRDYVKEQVFNQNSYNSCTANATCGVAQMFLIANKVYEDTPEVDTYDLSRLFNYYTAREYDFIQITDNGAYPRANLKTATKFGICRETLWPYTKMINEKPDLAAYADASQFKVTSYFRIAGEKQTAEQVAYQIKHALASGYPVMYGFFVHDNFYSLTKENDFLVPQYGNVHGGHEVFIVGYDETGFIVKNSWGESFANGGYFRMSWDHPVRNGMDIWVMKGFAGFSTVGPNQVIPGPEPVPEPDKPKEITPEQQYILDNYLVNPENIAKWMKFNGWTPGDVTTFVQDINPDITYDMVVKWLQDNTTYYGQKVIYTTEQQFILDNYTTPQVIADWMKANNFDIGTVLQMVWGMGFGNVKYDDIHDWLRLNTNYFSTGSTEEIPIPEPQI